MATRRTISTSICTSESVEALSEWAQLLLDRLIITADDFGVHEASPAKLKAITKPMSPRPVADFVSAVAEIAQIGIISLYEADGRVFFAFPKWDDHQTGLHKRTRSRFPDPKSGTPITPDAYRARPWFAVVSVGGFPEVPGSSAFPEVPGSSGTVPQNEGTERTEENSLLSEVKNLRTSQKMFPKGSTELELSELLFSLIRRRNTNHKPPDLQKWARQIDLMIRRDGRDPAEIRAVIAWAQADEFWQDNILCTEKLREQFDQLLLKSRTAAATQRGGNRPPHPDAPHHPGFTV